MIRTAIVDGVLAQLVERLNGIEEFLLRKFIGMNTESLLCHKLVQCNR